MDEIPDVSVALVVTSPPYFAGKEYEEALGHGEIPATYLQYLDMLGAVFAECVKKLEPGGRIAVNVANLGRRPYRSLSSDVVAILERDLKLLLRGEVIWQKARGFGGFVRVGFVPEGDQSGVARPHRAGRDREQGSLRPRADDRATQGRQPAVPVDTRARAVHGRHHGRVGDGARERAARATIPRRSRSSCRCGSSICTRTRATSCSIRSWVPAPPRSRPCAPGATSSATTPTPSTCATRSRASRRSASARPRRSGATSRSACSRPSRARTTPRTCSSRPVRCARARPRRKWRSTC